jgi:hypothetical protein
MTAVQVLGGEYPTEEARLEVLSEAEIQASFPPYGDKRLELTVQTLRLRKLRLAGTGD